MDNLHQLLVLSGILVMVVGLALRFNALLVVIVAGFVTGIAAQIPLREIITTIGDAFIKNRYMSLFVLVLPVIGLAEHFGLRERAEALILKLKTVTAGRIFSLYMLIRQVSVALGVSLGGHPAVIRPLIAPMGEAASLKGRQASKSILDRIRAQAAASENYGNFFGQLLFVASGGLLLIKGVLEQNNITIDFSLLALNHIPTPILTAIQNSVEQHNIHADLATMLLYCIPTAIIALILASARFYLFDKSIEKEIILYNTSSPEHASDISTAPIIKTHHLSDK